MSFTTAASCVLRARLAIRTSAFDPPPSPFSSGTCAKLGHLGPAEHPRPRVLSQTQCGLDPLISPAGILLPTGNYVRANNDARTNTVSATSHRLERRGAEGETANQATTQDTHSKCEPAKSLFAELENDDTAKGS